MDGGSKGYPPTWEGLYRLVEDVGCPAVAKQLKEAVEKSQHLAHCQSSVI